MSQETGSNPSQNIISISVRPLSNGDTFLIAEQLQQYVEDSQAFLRVELLTKRAMLLPAEILSRSSAEVELAAIGVMVGDDENVVSIEDRDLVAVAVVPKVLIRYLEEHYSQRYEFTSALLRRPVCADEHATLDVCDGLATVKIYNSGWRLRFVDTYDVTSTAMVVYWMQRLSTTMKLRSCPLYIYRYEWALDRLLSKNFKNIYYANSKRSI